MVLKSARKIWRGWRSSRLWQFVGLGAAGIYLLSLGLLFQIYFPMQSGLFGRGEQLGKKLFRVHLWLIDSGHGKLINVASSVAAACHSVGLFLGIPILLILGIRLLWKGVEIRRGLLLVSVGVVLVMMAMLGPVLVYSFWAKGIARLDAESDRSLSSLRKDLNRPDLTPRNRALVWGLYASSIYSRTGERVLIPTEAGEDVPYEPTKADESMRRQTLELREKLSHPYSGVPFWGCYAALWTVVGLLSRIQTAA